MGWLHHTTWPICCNRGRQSGPFAQPNAGAGPRPLGRHLSGGRGTLVTLGHVIRGTAANTARGRYGSPAPGYGSPAPASHPGGTAGALSRTLRRPAGCRGTLGHAPTGTGSSAVKQCHAFRGRAVLRHVHV